MRGAPDTDSISPVEDNVVFDTEDEAGDLDSPTGPEHSLLHNERLAVHPECEHRDYKMTPMGRLRAYWLGIVVCIGGFLCKLQKHVPAKENKLC